MSPPNGGSVLRVSGVRHGYGGVPALNGVDLNVAAGECVALLGPNGAGKTTLVNVVTGLLRRQHGSVELAGGDPRLARTRSHLGVVQQSIGFPSTLRVGELVAGAAVRGGASGHAATPVLAELDLERRSRERAVKLSGGQRQRLQLAMAIVTRPELLVLDEPTTGLDVPARRRFWEIIARRRAEGTAILLTTHLLDEPAEVADRVAVLDRGSVLVDEPPAALTARLPDRTVTVRSGLGREELAVLPGAVSLGYSGEYAHIGTREPEDLLRVLLDKDRQASDLRVEGAGLAEAIVALTGNEQGASHEPTG